MSMSDSEQTVGFEVRNPSLSGSEASAFRDFQTANQWPHFTEQKLRPRTGTETMPGAQVQGLTS